MAEIKFRRRANASWEGTGNEGTGKLSTQSKVLDNTQYSYRTRFEDGNIGTNPEELVGAAHAGCFTMQLSFLLNEAGFTATSLNTDATVNFHNGEIPLIDLEVTGEVPEISEKEFQEIANKAKEVCPVSKLMKAEVNLSSTLK